MEKLNVKIIKSPSDLKRMTYDVKEIRNVSKKLSLFENECKTPEEVQEMTIQKLVNYDGFWTSPLPNDYSTKEKISREDLIKSLKVYSIGGIVILIIVILTIKFVFEI